jgi:hypothetical protein
MRFSHREVLERAHVLIQNAQIQTDNNDYASAIASADAALAASPHNLLAEEAAVRASCANFEMTWGLNGYGHAVDAYRSLVIRLQRDATDYADDPAVQLWVGLNFERAYQCRAAAVSYRTVLGMQDSTLEEMSLARTRLSCMYPGLSIHKDEGVWDPSNDGASPALLVVIRAAFSEPWIYSSDYPFGGVFHKNPIFAGLDRGTRLASVPCSCPAEPNETTSWRVSEDEEKKMMEQRSLGKQCGYGIGPGPESELFGDENSFLWKDQSWGTFPP